MGLLDKLMFWKEETTELDFDVNGCFTLPTDQQAQPTGDAASDAAGQVDGTISSSDS